MPLAMLSKRFDAEVFRAVNLQKINLCKTIISSLYDLHETQMLHALGTTRPWRAVSRGADDETRDE